MNKKKAISKESYIIVLLVFLFFWFLAHKIGSLGLLFKIIMATAHDLLLNTVFLIMAISVLAGALAALFSEFGVIHLLNRLISKNHVGCVQTMLPPSVVVTI